ncbi:MAG: methylisocitrate lyase [Planctomycetota bacterium]|nr:methylisocitrate lyase [Planctomycetota bacterium]
MSMHQTPGQKFREAIRQQNPLSIVGTINAYTAMMATRIGHQAIYLSGAGCANFSYGLPDLGMTSLNDVVEDARRITSAVPTPLLVDIDTGWGGSFNIARTIGEMERAGVAAVHMEDQVSQKRCGHRPNKELVTAEEMIDRIKAAVDARIDDSFFIMARTDAYAVEGMQGAMDRSAAYLEAGADGIFAEAMPALDDYRQLAAAMDAPLLANLTEFGLTPPLTAGQLAECGVQLVLYPLTAARAMNRAAEQIYRHLLVQGAPAERLDQLQTRDELYDYLGYLDYEKKLDQLFGQQ